MRRWRRVALAAVAVWLLAATVLVGLGARAALDGRRALLAAQRQAGSAGALRSAELTGDLVRAERSLGSAHGYLASPLVVPFRYVPVAGRQLRSAISLAGAGAEIARTGDRALGATATAGFAAGGDRVQQLTALAAVAHDADASLAGIDLGPGDALIGPLARARAKAAAQIVDARDALARAEAGASGAASMLGGGNRYLVLAANSGEMRAGSGMFLSAGAMQTGGGALHLGEMTTVGQIVPPAGSVRWPDQLESLWGWLGRESDFRNLMVSPRFDVSAPLAAQVWERSGKGAVDGVLVIDPSVLRAVLSATGPVQVDGTTYSAANVLDQLMVQQYKQLTGTRDAQSQRREVLSQVARAAFDALDGGKWDPVVLARQLGAAAQGRHLMVWSRDPAVNEHWRKAGLSGELDANSLMLNVVNVGGNKLDQFLHVDATVARTTGRSGIDMVVSVKLTNSTPVDVPQYVAGPFPGSGLRAGEYQGLVSFSLPGDASGARFDGNPPLVVGGSDGPTQAFATKVQLQRGESKTVVIRFTRRATARTTVVEPSARVPATVWHADGATWQDDRSRRIEH